MPSLHALGLRRRPASLIAAAAVATVATAGAPVAAEPPATTTELTSMASGHLPTLAATPAGAGNPALEVAGGVSRWRVGVSVRAVGGSDARALPDPARLTSLPSADVPAAVLLGAVAGARRAAFLIAGRATAWGEGTCTPPAPGCHVLELGVGETELLDLPPSRGHLRRYAITVTAITRVHDASDEATRRRARRRSAAGLRVVRTAIQRGAPGLDRYRWSAARGVVVQRPDAAPAGG